MKEHITLQTADLFTGKIGLTNKQAEPRMGRLKKLKTGAVKGIPSYELYEIQGRIQLKRGEIICLDNVPKGMRNFLEPVKKSDDAEESR